MQVALFEAVSAAGSKHFLSPRSSFTAMCSRPQAVRSALNFLSVAT